MTEIDKIIDQMAENWPSNVVSRKCIREFTGGSLSPKTLANEDANGTGPEGRFLLMNQVCYPKDSVLAWLKSRSAKSWKERKVHDAQTSKPSRPELLGPRMAMRFDD